MEASTMPSTVEEVFEDYQGRREGLIRALTIEVRDFYNQCDPEKENLCLYGYPKGNWEVTFPVEEVPPELPEPALGINFARDGMEHRDWLSLIAVHSDSWLYAVAFYYCARFNKQDRKRLFGMINELPTVYEVVSGRKSVKEKTTTNNGTSKLKSSIKKEKPLKQAPPPKEEDENYEEDEEESETYCGICGGLYSGAEFWIACDICEKWFHGQLCLQIAAVCYLLASSVYRLLRYAISWPALPTDCCGMLFPGDWRNIPPGICWSTKIDDVRASRSLLESGHICLIGTHRK